MAVCCRHLLGAAWLTLGLLLPACSEGFDAGVGAFEVGEREALLWTRVAAAGAPALVPLELEVARDAAFTRGVRRMAAAARRSDDYTVRRQVRGLRPGTRYFYRFAAVDPRGGRLTSPVGTFRTAPPRNETASLRFVIAGDANLGWASARGVDFHVLSAAAAEDPDFFVLYGGAVYADGGLLPGGAAAESLDDYRAAHRATRADPHLQGMLATTGTFAGWDDHEIRTGYAGETVDPEVFENGARAFFEYLPLRSRPGRAPFQTHRSVRWGRDVEIFFLDGRQHRSAHRYCNEDPVADGPLTEATLISPFPGDDVTAVHVEPVFGSVISHLFFTPDDLACTEGELADPSRTMLGKKQLGWLRRALRRSTATFKILVSSTPLSSLYRFPYERWEGYPAEREALLDFVAANLDPDRTLVLSTGFQTNLAIRRDELTEVSVGPVAEEPFGAVIRDELPPLLGHYTPGTLEILDHVVDQGNGGVLPRMRERVLGSEHDVLGYALVEVFEDAEGPRLRVTARGNYLYRSGRNDPAEVRDLFSVEMPGGPRTPPRGGSARRR